MGAETAEAKAAKMGKAEALKLLEGAGDPALIAAAFLGNLCLL